MADHGYEEGRRDGKIEAMEKVLNSHDSRLDDHDDRFKILERITYGVLGAIFLINFLPKLQAFLG